MRCSASRSFSKPDASTLVASTSLHGWVAICTASVKGMSDRHTIPRAKKCVHNVAWQPERTESLNNA